MPRREGFVRLPASPEQAGCSSRRSSLSTTGAPTARKNAVRLSLLALAGLVVGLGFFGTTSVPAIASARDPLLRYVASKTQGVVFGGSDQSQDTLVYPPSAEELPPALSSLPDSLRRMTLISFWSSDNRPQYMNNFFQSAAANADVADLLFFHLTDSAAQCLDGRNGDFEDDGIKRDLAWDWENGGNIRVVCLTKQEIRVHEANWLCGKEGWACNEETYARVLQRLNERQDPLNVDWRPFFGEIYRSYFLDPSNPLWAWTDADLHLGDLRHAPFSLLSTVNIVAPAIFSPRLLFLPGQMCFFNLAAPGSIGAWKNFKDLQTAEAFHSPAEGIELGYAGERTIDEGFQSELMLRDEEGYAGKGLSWAFTSDTHGQDVFIPGRKFVLSGRHTLEVDADLSREEIEAIVQEAAAEPPSEYSGWSEQGHATSTPLIKGEACAPWFDTAEALCITRANLTKGDQYTRVDSIYRPTVLHITGDPVDELQVRMEPDRRPRRWQRKLFLHYQEIKRQAWWQLPPWYIGGADEIMEFDWKEMHVWRKGSSREEDIWARRNENLDAEGNTKMPEETRHRRW